MLTVRHKDANESFLQAYDEVVAINPQVTAQSAACAEKIHRETLLPARKWWKHPPRLQGFECCDQAWLNGVWREAYMDGLNFLFRVGGAYRRMHEPLAHWARRAGQTRVLDMASGGAGPIRTMLDAAERDGTEMPHFTLSDLHPNLDAFRAAAAAHPGKIAFVAESLDALKSRDDAPPAALRSICTGFHHFEPEQARAWLEAAASRSEGLFILEPMPCSWLSLLMSLPNVPVLMAAPFFAPRFSLKKCLISSLLPLVPLMIVWDGVVSALRMYRPEEILAMLPAQARKEWRWTWGARRYLLVYRAAYFCGYRKRAEDAA